MPDPYPPIEDYALIGDCHSVALVSRAGSIDWACFPRFDAPSCFGRILGWENGGYCAISAANTGEEPVRAYVDGSMVLATTFRTPDGECVLYDCFAMHKGGSHKP